MATSLPIYDGVPLLGGGKPSDPLPGLLQMRMVYGEPNPNDTGDRLWRLADNLDELPDREHLIALFGEHDPAVPVCLDIEHWSMPASAAKLASAVYRLKELLPTLTVGVYDMIPPFEYWALIRRADADPFHPEWHGRIRDYAAWLDKCRQVDVLARAVDFVSPAIYLRNSWHAYADRWRAFAFDRIGEARRHGKPVYPFICPVYHPSAEVDGLIQIEAWRESLAMCRDRADGAIVWAGSSWTWAEIEPYATMAGEQA